MSVKRPSDRVRGDLRIPADADQVAMHLDERELEEP